MIKARLLNSDAELNWFFEIGTIAYTPGENVDIVIQILDSQKNIRLIPLITSIVTLSFQKKDSTELDKVAVLVDADDRSMWKVSLSQAETLDIISGNIVVTLDEEGDGDPILKTVMYNAMSQTLIDGEC